MSRRQDSETSFSVRLTQAQRKVVAALLPRLADRLKLDESNQRAIAFTRAELRQIRAKVRTAVGRATTGLVRNSLRHVADLTGQALDRSQGIGAIPAAERVFQFKVTLLDTQPPIWRRIQAKDCTLDKLHEHIQTAMGWTNSHLNHFRVGDQLYGDPMLMAENFEDLEYEDSTTTKLSDLLPRTGKRFRFEYEYDFGDSWWHDVLFEGCVRAERGARYPVCVDGARACPPEDVGGTWGYIDFLDIIQNPNHKRREELMRWVGGSFHPEKFDAVTATERMRRGLPDWRRMI
jgi:hypothetical protein